MIETNAGIFILKVDIIAAGTQLRIGRGAHEFAAVECLAIGDEVYDPIEDRLVELTEIACVTLDNETIRDRGFSPKIMGEAAASQPLIYGVKVPVLLVRNGYIPPIRGEYQLLEGTVFFSLGFERRAILETKSCLCEFVRSGNHSIQNTPQRGTSHARTDFQAQR